MNTDLLGMFMQMVLSQKWELKICLTELGAVHNKNKSNKNKNVGAKHVLHAQALSAA